MTPTMTIGIRRMDNQCTCTKDKEATCIVHPTTRSLKGLIVRLEAELEAERDYNKTNECAFRELEADYHAERIRADRLFDELKALREKGDE